ncbi:uncharacterized protein LOC125380972 [Haliotis rufescens]|uniref:uncharacterized protein LOC125380972 n=1 Tax=Haliotis rufescens TaxID=6454 RepID=UPI00201E89EF|nr:uncharacterized protein LOC125380972 [Haliotis rufescens]
MGRKPNWSKEECLLLVQQIEANKATIKGKFGPNLTSDHKKKCWEDITNQINSAHPSRSLENRRTTDDIMKKWWLLQSNSREEIATKRKQLTGTGGGPAGPELSTVAEVVQNILGRDNTTISGLDGFDSFPEHASTTSAPESYQNPINITPSAITSASHTSSYVLDDLIPLEFHTPSEVSIREKRERLQIEVLELQKEYYSLKIKKLKSK